MLGTRTNICRQFRGGLSFGDRKYPSTTTGIPCSWAVPFKVACFSTFVAGWAYSRAGELVDGSYRCPTETGSVPFPIAVHAMQFSTSPSVMEATLVTFWKGSNVLLYGSWCGEGCGSMNSKNWCGCRSVTAGTMVDELLCQLLGAVEGSWSGGQYTIMNLG